MGKHTAGPRDWKPTRITEQNLVRYYGFRAKPQPVQYSPSPYSVRHMGFTEQVAGGVGDIFVGTIVFVSMVVVGFIRLAAKIVRAIRRRT